MENNEQDNGILYIDLPPVENNDLGIETALAYRIKDLEAQLESAKAEITRWEENYYRQSRQHTDMVEGLEKLLVNLIDKELITNTGAQEIAEMIGINPTKTVTVTGTISFTGQLEMSIFDDVDNLDRYDVSVSSFDLDYNYDSLSNVDFDIESVEFEEE